MSKSVYFVIHVAVHDPEGMKPYQAKVGETFIRHGGKRIVMGGAVEVLEGTIPDGKIVIVQFPSLEHAHAWHDSTEYQAILSHRLASAVSHAYLVEGVATAVD
ncbi:MAG: DUF1330 domain-containing protein [Cytophagaceae bacterium]|nr:MAG: DUF1330 domain-containing protein [Cytophagaceae bacterium]